MTNRIVLWLGSLLILIGTLTAGLWPFHSPKNGVAWLDGGGLSFGRHGSVLSLQPFRSANLTESTPCSLEIWLQPAAVHNAGTILAFYEPGSFAVQLVLRQSVGDLVVGRGDRDHPQHVRHNRIYVDDVFRGNGAVLITITSGSSGTTVYSNASAVRQSPSLRYSASDFAEQLILGNAPSTSDSWSGQLKGFAIYTRMLSSDEVKQHYSDWMARSFTHEEHAIALYPFDEGAGTVAHNRIDPATNLAIPERFVVPHKQFLEPPWDEFHPGWNYWKNIAINVLGFIPLGFFFYALFSAYKLPRPVLSVIIFGFAVSLTIEVLQGFLPTRDSGMTDLFTNTFGTALGALVFISAQSFWSRGIDAATPGAITLSPNSDDHQA